MTLGVTTQGNSRNSSEQMCMRNTNLLDTSQTNKPNSHVLAHFILKPRLSEMQKEMLKAFSFISFKRPSNLTHQPI